MSLGIDEMMSGHGGNECFDGSEAPDAEKVNLDLDGKRISECATLFPPHRIVPRVHFVSKWDLLPIVRRKESDLCAK